MDFYFRWVEFLSALSPYNGNYWRDIIVSDEAPPAAPIMAHTPAGEREPSRKRSTSAKKYAKAEFPAKKTTGAVPAPAASAKTPKGKTASVATGKKPAPPQREPPPKSAVKRAQAPTATMAEVEASLAAPSRDDERSLTVEDKAPVAAEVKAPVTTAAAPEPKAPKALLRRCRVHQRRTNPPPLRACLLCRLAAAKS